MRRMFDVAASALALFVLTPVLALIAALVLLVDGKPVLFRQTRVGRDFIPFVIWKFRTMNATDARITKLGRVLRRTRLDELPQLWNVLRGEMSIIGPRPEVPAFVDPASELWCNVLTVRPGLFDPATLAFVNEDEMLATYADRNSAYRESVLPQKLIMSARYLSTRDWSTDLKIMCDAVVLVGRRLAGR